MSSGSPILHTLEGGLIVSCQPVPDGALDRDDIVLALALASVAGGAAAIRVEGVHRVRLVAQHVSVPVIGIVKRDLTDSPVRITPFCSDVIELAEAGASIIAVDATKRRRPEPVANLLNAIHAWGKVAMADCSNLQDGIAARDAGFDCVGSTLSGYTDETRCADDAPPDDALVRHLSNAGVWVIAEGRIGSPQLAKDALSWGAKAVTVGSALTRLEWMVSRYAQSMQSIGRGVAP